MSETAVIVNEFGEVGIDASLLPEGTDVIELTSGCICCTLSVDLTLTLKRILERFHLRRVLMEASGVADPGNIAAVLQQEGIKEKMRLHRTITVLDAQLWEMRELFGQLFSLQLRTADTILLNKIDLFSKERIRAFLEEIRQALPHARVVPTLYCRIDPESLWSEGDTGDPHELELDLWKESGNSGARDHGPSGLSGDGAQVGDAGFVTFSYRESRPFDERMFRKLIDELPFEVFRVKGMVRFPGHTMLLNYVGGRAEWSSCTDGAETRLAFVGWHTDGEETIGKLKACIVS